MRDWHTARNLRTTAGDDQREACMDQRCESQEQSPMISGCSCVRVPGVMGATERDRDLTSRTVRADSGDLMCWSFLSPMYSCHPCRKNEPSSIARYVRPARTSFSGAIDWSSLIDGIRNAAMIRVRCQSADETSGVTDSKIA